MPPKLFDSKKKIALWAILIILLLVIAAYFIYMAVRPAKENLNSQKIGSDSALEDSAYAQRENDNRQEYLDNVASMEAAPGVDDSATRMAQTITFYNYGEWQKAVDAGEPIVNRESESGNMLLFQILADSYKELGQKEKEAEMIRRIVSLADRDPDLIEETALNEYKDRM